MADQEKADERALDIALWGPSAAGKTMLLARLFSHTGIDDDWSIFPESVNFAHPMGDRILLENRFPSATTVGKPEKVVCRLYNRRTGRRASLSIEDRAGKHFEDLDEPVLARLAEANGLILLFDLQRQSDRLKSVVTQTLERLHLKGPTNESGRDPRPYAVCLTKADTRFSSASDVRLAREQPEAYVAREIPQDLVAPLRKHCERYRLFPLSAAGVDVRHGSLEPIVFVDEGFTIRLRSCGVPVNLIEPFSWLLLELEAGR